MNSVNIIIGSQMGSAEYVGEQLAEQLVTQGITTEVHDQPNFSQINQENTIWLLCTSTYGAGDYPENLLSFVEDINQVNDLKGLKFSVIGLGDTSYDTYNLAGRNLEQLLVSKGAHCIAERLELNILDEELPEDTALAWLPSWIEQINRI
ncbi:flavodoxin domain-containing protein [Pseudoalteromonas sp. SG43-7]|jgi:MioC protein|uniref:FMN-binding protein MioC n=1 Tax=Pseudoalteromonas neustonica TaxID=1840331 RepID=A0ABY3F8Y1_9GAMM|nr:MULTISPECIES: flavodoxin domain-containing protein [Pseudoalteromonas]MBB1295499.1 flavodoxin domain-containing protein [Pseudoalteromonas sp. SR41-4]MBB1302374.1 flavodoxin domain-containing protein [Pseudoalteromonas sp. SR44-8]MBB1343190.1 flavodoxin domain-containing protein [Pseudoalteromonas sp. SR45-6]MBB1410471.1 flavodoxin domain-containing protein [Pseudoalteromonas sp. SG44-17]MBB1423003.1 flavodoxin domain-containing protein [Pseudoalteromonas sp. SG43-7]|tara:strand:- start:11776 stop:12225 length:450 start_codon:yes stop_codon:yes gene_type:complete